MTTSGGRRRVALSVLAVAIIGLGLGCDEQSASAAYVVQGLATAAGERMTVTSSSIPVFATPVDASMPLADAAVDARGNSTAQAAYPYPGDTAYYGVTGAVAPDGVTLPVPIPGNEVSSYPLTPAAHADYMAYRLLADSGVDSSSATATSGADSSTVAGAPAIGTAGTNSATASVTVTPATGLVSVAAHSVFVGATMGPLVLGQVESSVTMTRLPGKPPSRVVTMNVGKTTVMGQEVAITPTGLTLPAGAPVGVPNEAASLNHALSAAGITVSYLSEIDSPDGTVAPGIEVQSVTTAAQGVPSTTTYIYGQAAASVLSGGSPDMLTGPVTSDLPSQATPGSATPTPPTGTTKGPAAVKPAALAASAAVPVATAAAPPPGSTGVTMPSTSTGVITAPPTLAAQAAPVVAASPAIPETPAAIGVVADRRRAGDGDLGASGLSFYLVLVGAGIAVVVSGSVLRSLGVRLLWTR